MGKKSLIALAKKRALSIFAQKCQICRILIFSLQPANIDFKAADSLKKASLSAFTTIYTTFRKVIISAVFVRQ